MKKFVICGVLIMAVNSALAVDIFSTLDVNQDQLISIEEASIDTILATIFADLDANQDGFLSKSEFSTLEVR
ncbi:MAG: Ca2+-binding EF-hand superfamily protein [Paraglaciecola sp.]|jgi:Ca2+-binding EF-hand superfamily protein